VDLFTAGNDMDGFIMSKSKIPILQNVRTPSKSNLKRRLAECIGEGEDYPDSKRLDVDESTSTSSANEFLATAKKKRNIQFDAVTVYYFPRAQGFTCVPSQVNVFIYSIL
jgi:hypothetical protein